MSPTRRVRLKAWLPTTFPVRVWQNFAHKNGLLLSAGIGYHVLFAMFALLYVLFATAGLWLGASPAAIDALVRIVDTYVPGLIGGEGPVSVTDVTEIARGARSVLSVTGVLALAVALWTAVGAVTATRLAVRDLFGVPFDRRSFWLLKSRDFFAAIVFGGALLFGAVLSWAGVWAMENAFDLLGWNTNSAAFAIAVRTISIMFAFGVDAVALAMLVKFLTGTPLRWQCIWPGALLGGGGVVALQLAAGLLLSSVPGNPLLASFAVLIGLLLWCRWLSVAVLIAASWIAVAAETEIVRAHA